MDRDNSGVRSDPPLTRVAVDPDESVVVAVIRAVAAIENDTVTDLPPLGPCIDPEALETLVASPGFTGAVTFEYVDYTIRVDGGESVAVYGDVPEE